MRKFISMIMAVVMIASLCGISSFAADLTNSVGSVAADADVLAPAEPVGNDATQSKVSEYVLAVDESTATAETTNETVSVYATQASTYSVKIPKTIILDGSNGNGAYKVALKGNISGAQTIRVTPVASFTLSEVASTDAKADITATITQAKTAWTTSEISSADWTTQEASIAAPAISAGIWNGTFAFTIELVNAA